MHYSRGIVLVCLLLVILSKTGFGQSICYNHPFFSCDVDSFVEEDVLSGPDGRECCHRGHLTFINPTFGDGCQVCVENSICYNSETDSGCGADFPGVGLGSTHDCCLRKLDGGTYRAQDGFCNQCSDLEFQCYDQVECAGTILEDSSGSPTLSSLSTCCGGPGLSYEFNNQCYTCNITCDPSPSSSPGLTITPDSVPVPALVGSVFTFLCTETNQMIESTCDSDGLWNPDPENYECPVLANCTVPVPPSNGSIVEYESLDSTVVEGTVLTYKCDSGLVLTGTTGNITCDNNGHWSQDPLGIMCVENNQAIIGALVAACLIILVLATIIVILVVVLLASRKGKAVGTDSTLRHVYDEIDLVSPVSKNEPSIELQGNQAYGKRLRR